MNIVKGILKDLRQTVKIQEVFLSMILSVVYSVSSYAVKTKNTIFANSVLLKIFVYFIYIYALIFVCKKAYIYLTNNNKEIKIINNKAFLVGVIFICWIPTLVMLYPGTLNNDSWGQLQQIISLKQKYYNVSAMNPILDTCVMSIAILPIGLKLGRWHEAFFLYVIVQSFITSCVFAYTIIYAKRKLKLNDYTLMLLLIIYAIFPIFPTASQLVGKDSLAGWIFALFMISYLELIRTKGEMLNDNRKFICFLIISVLSIITKKVELYIILISLALTLLFLNDKKRLLSIIGTIIVLNFMVVPVLHYTFSIKKSGPQEMLALPFQQTARYVIKYKDEVTEEEKQIIDKVIDYDDIEEKYIPTNADPIRKFWPKGNKEDYKNYIIEWVRMFFKHPGVYFEAFGYMFAGWTDDAMYMPVVLMKHHTQLDAQIIPEWASEREDGFAKSTEVYIKIYELMYKVPVLTILLSFGFYTFIFPVLIGYVLFKNIKKDNLINIMPLITFVLSIGLGCLLSSVSNNGVESKRYVYPIVYTFCIYLMWIIYCTKKEGAKLLDGKK